jgi:phage gp46-like protein
MQLTIAPLGRAELPVLPPDIVWDGSAGDFAIETDTSQNGVGGFAARNPLQTAVVLLLFSDARCEVTDLKLGLDGDRRGWPGDAVDVDTAHGEAPLGSLLWLYRREKLDDAVAMKIEAEAKRALLPLIKQQACVAVATKATIKGTDRVDLAVQLFGRDGREVYAGKFGPLWARIGN